MADGLLKTKDWAGKALSGGWKSTGAVFDVIEPATGEALAQVARAGAAEVRAAATAAKQSQQQWAHGGPANWDEFTQWQWTTVRDKAPAYPL